MFAQSGGLQSLLKEGHKHYSGLEESMLKNIDAVKEISKMTRSSLGPLGLNKMVINHLEKLFVTSDSATIVKELEVQHPAAKMIVNAAKMQESEAGDGTNFVIIIAGELMKQAEGLIKMGLHPSEIITGYEKASKKAIELLDKMECHKVENIRSKDEINLCVKSVIGSKIYGQEDILAPLVTEACLYAMPKSAKHFNVDNIRVCKILGSALSESEVIRGMAVTRNSETSIHHVKDPKVAVYNCELEAESGDTKGTVLIKNAEDLRNYTKSEEEHMEKFIKGIADAGVTVVVGGGSISDIALHFFEKYKILVVKILSKFELKRIAKTLGATLLVRHGPPTAEEIGYANEVSVTEIGSQKVTIFRRDEDDNRIATILLRGSTTTMLDDSERAIDDGVNTVKGIAKDNRFVAGAGATELRLASEIQAYAKTQPGLDQYAINKFGEALEIIPRTLVENAGYNAEEIIAKLYSEQANTVTAGVDIETGKVRDAKEMGVYDSMETKSWALKLTSDAVMTVLRVDQIIVAKPAGGPKPRNAQAPDMD